MNANAEYLQRNLSVRNWKIAYELVPGLAEESQRVVAVYIEEKKAELEACQGVHEDHQAEYQDMLNQLLEARQKGGLFALWYWLVVLPWLRWRLRRIEDRLDKSFELSEERHQHFDDFVFSVEAQQQFVQAWVMGKINAYRKSAMDNLAEIMGIEKFGRQTVYRTDHLTAHRDWRQDWWVEVLYGCTCSDGYVIIVLGTAHRKGWRGFKDTAYDLCVVDLDEKRVAGKVTDPCFGRGSAIIVREDNPERIQFVVDPSDPGVPPHIFFKETQRIV